MCRLICITAILLACLPLAGQQIVWEKELRLSSRDLFYSGVEAMNNTYMIAGESRKWSRSIGGASRGGLVAALIDTLGDTLWVKYLGFNGNMRKVIKKDDSTFLFIANYYLDSNPRNVILHVSSTGTVKDTNFLPYTNLEQIPYSAIYHNGFIYLAGRQYPSSTPGFTYDMWAAKIEPNTGTVVWSRTYNLNHPVCVANSIEPTPYGTYMLGGYQGSRIVNIEITTDGVMIDNQMLYQNQNNIVFTTGIAGQIGRTHYVANGNFRFNNQSRSYFGVHSRPGNQRRWGGESPGYATKPFVNADSSIIYQVGNGVNTFVGRLDLDSNYFWRISLSQSSLIGNRAFNDIVYNEDETGILIGSIVKSGAGPSGEIFYMAKFTGIGRPFDPTGVHHPHLTEKQGGIYPNPVKDFFRFRKQYSQGEVAFYLPNGQEAYRRFLKDSQPISIAHLKPGLYLYRCWLDGRPYSGRLFKE